MGRNVRSAPRLPSAAGWVVGLAAAAALSLFSGCEEDPNTIGRLERVWGKVGISDGLLQKPRAMTIDPLDHIYIVDMTARIQVFDTQGNYLRGWKTPEWHNGRPTGLSIDRDGRLMVADTHYHRILIYSPEGDLLRTVQWKRGDGPGEFDLVADVVQDSEGSYYVSEYGDNNRVQKFDSEWRFLLQWGGHGSEPGQFARPQCLALDEEERLWVADSCNHRIQVFDRHGKFLQTWGSPGSGPGELKYPYGLVLGPDHTVYVVEWGNNRVQKFTRDGRPLGWWGTGGRERGQLFCPWALVQDQRGRIHVLDTNNHRVQTVRM
jgi:DNA-binding beta-propeller fold protein YncE